VEGKQVAFLITNAILLQNEIYCSRPASFFYPGPENHTTASSGYFNYW
jgi:hypothetical protein